MPESILTGLTIVVALLVPAIGAWTKLTAQLTRIETAGAKVSEELDRHRSDDRETFRELQQDITSVQQRLAGLEAQRNHR